MGTLIEGLGRVLAFAGGLSLVVYTVLSAIRSFVLPRSARPWLTAIVFRGMNTFFFRWRVQKAATYEDRDRIMALYAPITLFVLPLAWLTSIILGYTGMIWAVSSHVSVRDAFVISGSSMMTLGFKFQDELAIDILAFSEAALGMMMVALLIGFLPTMYSAFSQREVVVTMLQVRAGVPPSALEMISRLNRIGMLSDSAEMKIQWEVWEEWFAAIDESHTTLAPLVFFRSPKPHISWVTAAGVILDAGAIVHSSVDYPQIPHNAICIRAGFVALRSIADFFDLPYPPNPTGEEPISISRAEFDQLYDDLQKNGVPLKADREDCWKNYRGWRVNYDSTLLQLARLTTAPYAPWVSDRSILMPHHKKMKV